MGGGGGGYPATTDAMATILRIWGLKFAGVP